MSGVCVDYLDVYRKFFDTFALTVDPTDQLPVKVAGYNLLEEEIAGAVADWALQYLESRKCPIFLIAHLVRKVLEEVKVQAKGDPVSCGYRHEYGDFLSLRLMQVCITKLVEVCFRYQDNAELSSLPPPNPLPPTASCAVKNSRRSMEDRHVVIHDFHTLFNIKDYGPASYYGVFDGHNGIDAAIYSVSHLHQFLAESQYYPKQPMLAMREACIRTDKLFSSKAENENLHGGTTAVYALLRPKERKLFVGWLGDSLAVLVRRGVPYQIVRAHKPDRSDERDRIQKLGGTILFWGAWRVNGQLALSRAIGDTDYKPYVCAEPDVEEITLDGTEDFLILGCDGLWDFVKEKEATDAVYEQLQESTEDLEAVSHRLVALAKENCSHDNISVVVVFLADPAEVAGRRPMEATAASPFVTVNGADTYRGGPTNGQHPALDDIEDFGPETDVDMVDDVLMSPAIAVAKALVQGKQDLDDDLERQRQQLSDFDDPADMDPSRDTPTPPAHEVASNANLENLAESGGEESEEEWNYFPGKDNDNKQEPKEEDPDDMSSQLNPNAAEFVPVSPTRLLLLDDAIISASPSVGFEKSMDNVQLPSEREFASEISQRPGELDITNGPKHGDYFMRDNFSLLRNKSKDLNASSTCAVFGDDSVQSFSSDVDCFSTSTSENVPFDKLDAVQNIEEKVTSAILDKEGLFPTGDSNSAFGMTNIFNKSDTMVTSTTENDECSMSPEIEDNYILGLPKSAIVKASVSPVDQLTELDSPADDYVINTQKSPDLISPGDGPQDNLIYGQERTCSSGFESESGPEEGEANVPDDNNEGFITEHRRSPPIDLSFKPIQTFSDTNPFGALQTPSATTPLDQFNTITEIAGAQIADTEIHTETPLKNEGENLNSDKLDYLQNTPSSFVSLRHSVSENTQVPFDELESPKEDDKLDCLPITPSSFVSLRHSISENTQVPFDELESPKENIDLAPPILNANSSPLASDLPKTPEPTLEDNLSSVNHEPVALDLSEGTNPEYEETSFTNYVAQQTKETTPVVSPDLDTTIGFVAEETKILKDELECEQISKLKDDGLRELDLSLEIEDISPKTVEQVLAEFDDIKDDPEEEIKSNEPDFEQETKEMKLEFESHIANSSTSPDELRNIVDSFEVIHKDELALEDNILSTHSEPMAEAITLEESVSSDNKELQFSQESIDILSPSLNTNPFIVDDTLAESENIAESEPKVSTPVESSIEKNLLSAIDDFSEALTENLTTAEQVNLLSSPLEMPCPVEPQATKTVSYQMLTPADEPKLTKSELYVTGVEEQDQNAASPLHVEEPLIEEIPVVVDAQHEISSLDVDDPLIDKEDSAVAEIEATSLPLDTEDVTMDKESVVSLELHDTNSTLKTEAAEPIDDESTGVVEPEMDNKPVSEAVSLPEENVEREVIVKSEPVQSQVVTETLITTLEETSEVPSVIVTEDPSSAGTPPSTPAPGIEDSKEDTQKTDILVAAAVAAAGAVAAGTALVTDHKIKTTEAKKTTAAPTKKAALGAPKGPVSSAKAPVKAPVASKAPATKPTTKPTISTTKPASTATGGKSPSLTVASKTAPAKAPAVPAKKPTMAAPPKPTTAAPPKPTSAAPAKPTTAAPAKPTTAPAKSASTAGLTKQVPNKLPVNKTSAPLVMKSSSKPTTPTSKPTTPTTPKSPSVIKSPPRPAAKTSQVTTKTSGPTKPAVEKPADKKPIANGDTKTLAKKDEIVKKTTSMTAKPLPTTRPTTAPPTKPLPSAKPITTTAAKVSVTKTAAVTSTQPKTKTAAPTTVAAKRPSTAPATKVGEKTGKETVTKQISTTKPVVNGKVAPPKTSTAIKKTDAKVNGKTPSSKPAPIKKSDEVIKVEKEQETQIQEDNVTTTNGFTEHIMVEEHGSLKIEELAPIIVDGVN